MPIIRVDTEKSKSVKPFLILCTLALFFTKLGMEFPEDLQKSCCNNLYQIVGKWDIYKSDDGP